MGQIVHWEIGRKCGFKFGERSGMNINQKVFWRMKIIRYLEISQYRQTMLLKGRNQILSL